MKRSILNIILLSYLGAFTLAAQTNGARSEDKIRTVVEVLPYYNSSKCAELNGQPKSDCAEKAMFDFVYSKIDYPQEAVSNKTAGKVVIKCVVEKDGSLSNCKIEKNLGSGCGEATLKAVQSIEKFVPAQLNGKPVRVYYSIPIKFPFKQKKVASQNQSTNPSDGQKPNFGKTMKTSKIAIEAKVLAGVSTVWNYYTKPDHIVHWNFANDDWQCPRAENDLKVGGKYIARMEAKDGSFGFDFEGIYDEIIEYERLTYTLLDGRKVTTTFEENDGETKVTTIFDPEQQNSVEMQKQGWQAILNNFKKYVESIEAPSLQIVRQFKVKPAIVFDMFTNPKSMPTWWGDNVTFDLDVRVGGKWTIVRKAGETVYTALGEYLVVEPPHRLVYSYAMPQFSPNTDTISIQIDADGEAGSVLTFTVSGKDTVSELKALPEGSISESEKGWQMGFDLMEQFWEK